MKGVGYVCIDSKGGQVWLYDNAENGLPNKLIVNTKNDGTHEVSLNDEMLRNLAYTCARMYYTSTGQRCLMPQDVDHPVPAVPAPEVQPVARVRDRVREPLVAQAPVRERVRSRAPA